MLAYLKYLTNFYSRRLWIPVDRNALVLDIGGGNLPHWRADVVCDKSIGRDRDRSHGSAAAVCSGFMLCEIEHLPFADRQFDWGICSHVLEHVEDPERAIAEYVRCCKAGALAAPAEAFEKLHGWNTGHRWFVRLEGGVLVFTPKTRAVFDPHIASFVKDHLMPTRQWRSFYLANAEKFETRLLWKDRFHFVVQRSWEANDNLEEPEDAATEQGGCGPQGMNGAYRAFRTVLRAVGGVKPVDLPRLLVCARCKGPLSGLKCQSCGSQFRRVNGVFDMRLTA